MARFNRHQVPLDDDEFPFSSETSESSLLEKHGSDQQPTKKSLLPYVLTVINLVLMIISISLVSTSLRGRNETDSKCLKLHSWYSPALKEIDPTYQPVKFNGSLNYPSIYRGEPSPEVDAAWDVVEHLNAMRITEADVLKVGKTKDAVKIPAQYGGGYLASVEVNHQLHCINFLRKSLFPDYYSPPSPHTSIEFTDHPSMIKTHQGHCIEMLRQFVMCHADVGVITHHFVKGYPQPYPDFNTWHQCRNFDSVLEWARGMQLLPENGGPPKGWNYAPGDGDTVFELPP